MKAAVAVNGRRPSRERCWQAVLAHDARMDRVFVYAVRSTGVYCLPSCTSRRPRRDQVLFYAVPEAAEHAGFRPCRKCRPKDFRAGNTVDRTQAAWIAQLCREIERDTDNPVRLRELALRAKTSPHRLLRSFRRLIGVTPRQYVDAVRLRKLKGHLQSGDDVTTALYRAGYGSSSRLYERANAQLGMTPATYRQGGKQMQISYTIEPCSMGRVLVAATEKGVSAVYLGDQEQPLECALRKEYPRAEIRREPRPLGAWVKQIVRHLSGSQRQLDLPLDVEATAFQRRVYEELRKIPYGKTKTYGQVAAAIGQPTAVRAVARACATNPVSVVVPCHRVVRGDGKLAGYRWGLDKKQKLVEQEKAKTA